MISIKTVKEIEILREGGRILARILAEIVGQIKPGITTGSLNVLAEQSIKASGAQPAFLGYSGFPAALCTSVNEVIVHGVPGKYALKEGDIIGLDLGIIYKDLITDMAVTVPVGKISSEAQKLIQVTKKSLETAIKEVKPGKHLGDISHAIQDYVESQGFGVVRELIGHGVGYEVHEEPEIPNFGRRGEGPELKTGMVLAIEPMVSGGDWHIKQRPDGSFATRDGSLVAHFEHTVVVNENSCEVLTKI